jgi:GDP-L-fucose synthase
LRKDARIYVAGGQTLIGAAILRRLPEHGFHNVCDLGDCEPDCTSAVEVNAFFDVEEPEYVFVAAGQSGGIAANRRRPAELIRDNLLVALNVIHAAHRYRVAKLLYLASSCAYPRLCPQPISEDRLMTGPLEPTNAAYATAKLAGIELCRAYRQQHDSNFIVGIPANAFGPGDDYSPEDSHVIGALIRRFHEAKCSGAPAVSVWGTGEPRREFIFADDLADACLLVMHSYEETEPINLGTGQDLSIRELAEMIREVVGYDGRLEFDASKPDGMPRKALDGRRLAALGWTPRTSLREGLARTYEDFLVSHSTQSAPTPRTRFARPGASQG